MKKYLTKFSTRAEYTAALENLDFPNVTYLSEDDELVFAQNAPESPYEMRFFDSKGVQIDDLDRHAFEPLGTYAIKLYDNDNEDYVATTDWSPEITYDETEVRAEEDAKSNQYTFSVDYVEENTYVNVKAIMDRQTVDEVNLLFVGGL